MGWSLPTQRWWGSVTALRMACASAQLAVELRAREPNEMVATPCAGELVVATMGSHALDHLTQCRWGSVTALRSPVASTVVLRILESVCASDRNCAAALPTSKNCSPLLRLVALGMVHEAQGTIFTGYFYESSFRNLQCQIYET